MQIAVCIKQVPVLSAMQFDPATKTLKREGVPNEVSAFDIRALLKAVELRTEHGGEVVAITMGPPQARDALLTCLALGADRAVHLCDRAFAGADTLATARALALALQREPFDLILCGRSSVDAETGQVGPEVAELLHLPQVTGARTLTVDPSARQLSAERETDDGFETVIATLPVLVTAAEDLASERFASKAEREAAKTKPCIEIAASDLSAQTSQFGGPGSPTTVIGLQELAATRTPRLIEAGTVDEAVAQLTRILVDEHGLFGTWKVREQPAIAELAKEAKRNGPSDVWVMSELLGDTLRPVVFELLGKATAIARALGSRVSAVLVGNGAERHMQELAAYGAERILVADDPRLATFDAETHAAVLARAIQAHRPGMVLVPATGLGRDLAPRVAARLELGLTGDCIDLGLDGDGRLLQFKPAFGGSVVAPIVSRTRPEMATVRPGMLAAVTPDFSRTAAREHINLDDITPPRTRRVSLRTEAAGATELDTAAVVIGIGKGIGEPAHLNAIKPLAELLGAATCTTRDVTDAGWLPRQYQVGLTGRAIAPKLYLAIAIRGAFEHMVGVRRAGLIVAINKNPKAPIFKQADYGLVADYVEAVPALCRHLDAARAASRS